MHMFSNRVLLSKVELSHSLYCYNIQCRRCVPMRRTQRPRWNGALISQPLNYNTILKDKLRSLDVEFMDTRRRRFNLKKRREKRIIHLSIRYHRCGNMENLVNMLEGTDLEIIVLGMKMVILCANTFSPY